MGSGRGQPRGTLALDRCSRAYAWLGGRDHVTPDDVRAVAPDCLRHRAAGFSLLPRQPVASLLAGGHASKLRGLGLDFDEIRKYLPGDDPRTIDWKVTARTRTPHARVFTEERGRPVLLVVDQRTGMFFGSVRLMKSVAAAKRFLLTREVPVLPLRTDADVADQILRALGARPGAGRARPRPR